MILWRLPCYKQHSTQFPACQGCWLAYHTSNKSSCSMLCLLTLYLWSPGDTNSKLSGDRSLTGSPNTLRKSDTFICAVAWPMGSPSWRQTSSSYQANLNPNYTWTWQQDLPTSFDISRCLLAKYRAFSWLPIAECALPKLQHARPVGTKIARPYNTQRTNLPWGKFISTVAFVSIPSPTRSTSCCAMMRCRRWYSTATG